MKTFTISSEHELDQIVQFLIPKIESGGILALQGELGAGKTTLTKKLIFALGSQEIVTSPTFTIVNNYATNSKHPIFHLDLYRLINAGELDTIGFSEIIENPQHIVIIEWPELAKPELTKSTIWVELDITGNNKRNIIINV